MLLAQVTEVFGNRGIEITLLVATGTGAAMAAIILKHILNRDLHNGQKAAPETVMRSLANAEKIKDVWASTVSLGVCSERHRALDLALVRIEKKLDRIIEQEWGTQPGRSNIQT